MIDEKAREAGKQIKKELIEELLEAEIEEHLPLRYAKKRRGYIWGNWLVRKP